MDGFQCAGFDFFSNFDSANLAKVELVPLHESMLTTVIGSGRTTIAEIPDVEFNIWTKPDCNGTEFENGNRTWFYFGMRANAPGLLVRINMVDLNRQGKMYSQGMAPVYRILPGKPNWDRIRDKPTYTIDDDIFTLSFKYKTPENSHSITYLAFTYPYSYIDLQYNLNNLDTAYLNKDPTCNDDIYYHRECVCYSLDGRRVDLLTISSYHDISYEREASLKNLFTDNNVPRSYRFIGKKVIFISARVHPGETPSSFVFNGLLGLLLNREDPIAVILRKLYVFKLIPFLNPDGVSRGHYRTDTRGVNLNRMYLNPVFAEHPSVYAARALIRYYHFGYEKEDDETISPVESSDSLLGNKNVLNNDNKLSKKVSHMTLEENENNRNTWCAKCKTNIMKLEDTMPGISTMVPTFNINNSLSSGNNICRQCGVSIDEHGDKKCSESGIFLYLDMHGHASKKGIFMYGNHFQDIEDSVECMLLPKILSLNNHNFHFTACNFTEKNMYHRDRRDGMSREGSGRVAVLKLTGLVKSYTLECNYNTGRLVNVLPPTIRESSSKPHMIYVPPKYTPHVFDEVGKAIGISILDLTGQNPQTRVPNSEFHTLHGLRDWLRINCLNELGEIRSTAGVSRLKLRHSSSLRAQAKSIRPVVAKTRSTGKATPKKLAVKSNRLQPKKVPIERKENVTFPIREAAAPQPCCSHSSAGSIASQRNRRVEKATPVRPNPKKPPEKTSKVPNQTRTVQSTGGIRPKFPATKEKKTKRSETDSDAKRLQLREICFLKDAEGGKKVIAKYKTDQSTTSDNNLIVAWDASTPHSAAQIFSNQVLQPSNAAPPPEDAGPSRNQFRVHNFRRAFPKSNRSQRLLRRLGSVADSATKKIKKRKKLKSKML